MRAAVSTAMLASCRPIGPLLRRPARVAALRHRRRRHDDRRDAAAHPTAESGCSGSRPRAADDAAALLIVSRVARRHGPLGMAAAVVAWLGFAGLAFLVTPTRPHWQATDAGLPTDHRRPAVADRPNSVASTATALFVAGHIIGVVLPASRSGQSSSVGAVGLIVSQPLHFVVAVIVPNHPLDVLAWVLTAAGFTAAAVAGRRSRDARPTTTR